ncbi:AT-rich interactive domain-containing protein 5B-like isoform X2 [Macrosteles quadrilineatus]|uniref:AT-rich interactive domain-containing protein 5B-like isoform X2 n=1 Tax=Macrosteles quadrilineatus TaxID=74068 RepID=UPI0023E1B614|nr:AT-rich interactive domain-containing protein 5B-like isoform X2 [Macrosteles quadrilineatus]
MDFKLIGAPCGQHGPYTFYKAFKYSKHGKTNILALSEFFFVKLWNDSDLVSIGELQLLWEDKNNEQTLASLRLYILPENTPEGRSDCHGEHEVLAITEKVVLRVEDLLTWITEAQDWSWGLSAVYDHSATLMPRPGLLADNCVMDLTEVDKEKDLLGKQHWDTASGVVVLSFPRYCRYRGILKRLEGVHNKWLRTALVAALGGFIVPCRNTRVLYCKETFDYPDLEGHELLCNHLAPKLKGRPRKKRKLLDLSQESSDSDSESSSVSTSSSSTKAKSVTPVKQISLVAAPRRGPRGPHQPSEEKDFFAKLQAFMRSRQTPISRVPTIGFKELNLWKLFSKVRHLGGYDTVTSSRLWKYVYEEMGGDQSSTSAATCCRRHYERLLLPYERHVAPNRTKNAALAKLKKYEEISITEKSSYMNAVEVEKGIFTYSESVIDLPREKENIPHSQSRSFSGVIDLTDSPVKQKNVEIIDLVSDDSHSPLKTKPPTATKKQKLEILREGGLEVTPVGTVCESKPRPSVIQHVERPREGSKEKVSITITPDVALLLPKNRHAWSLGNHNVYGNPKDVVQSSPRPNGGEVLDLRTRNPYTPVGSNLEITLVPPSSSENHIRSKKPQLTVPIVPRPNHSQKLYQPPRTHPPQRAIPPLKPMHSLMASRIPNNPGISINANQQRRKNKITPSPQTPHNYPAFKTSPYPMVDPVYLSAFYSSLFSPFSPTTTPQQLQMYKDLLHRQNIPDSFPRLLQDGSTSISLVDQSPSPSSK